MANNVIDTNKLTRKFGDVTAVNKITFKVRKGELYGLLGPNGAGKTTSIRMMCGLLKPTSGEVYIHGQPVLASPGRILRTRVGICPQENILWSKLTCFEQLVFSARMYNVPRSQARVRADHLLQVMGLWSKRNKLAGTLSGGLKRRMNVIMAMMHDPDILVFDEPEAGLDPQSRVMVRDFISETALSKTVIVTTHNMDEAERIATRVAIIDSGRLLQLDTPDNLKRSIGKGDVMELRFQAAGSSHMKRSEEELEKLGYSVIWEADRMEIRAMNLIPGIHEIYKILEREDLTVQEMKVRENTLEDVFIHLTGKSLRP